MRYEIEEYENILSITENNYRYSLRINLSNNYDHQHQRTFFIYNNGDTGFLITARDIKQYPREISTFLSNPDLQYIDVGCGLGEFLPLLVKKQKKCSPKPIAIDPANYPLMKDILTYALTIDEGKRLSSNLDVLIERTNFFIESKKIILINEPIEKAVESHKEIIHFADGVVDNFGPHLYQTKFKNLAAPIECLEMRLLKPNGKLILG